jgi:glycogen(starch) synthase
MVETKTVCPNVVFEASWEVTNKCGGIYTVVTSKIQLMQANYGSYYLIGPLFDTIPSDFIQEQPPEPYARAFAELAREGIRCVYGTWNIPGRPDTILVDARSLWPQVDEIKTLLWDHYRIDSLFSAGDFAEPLLWSWGVGKLLRALEDVFHYSHVVAHFHEWLAGFALLYLKEKHSRIATVFTTHATMLGRTLASNDPQAFDDFEHIDAEATAKKYSVSDKFSTERACALNAHVFTTVSTLTAKECKAFFGRDPDILPNGLEIDTFPTFDDASFRHFKFKEKLYDYMIAHFFPHYTFDLTQTLFYYFGGRYEYKNKGLDITIDSLARLNDQLKEEKSTKTIVMLFFVAWNAGQAKSQLLENRSFVDTLTGSVHEQADYFLQRIVMSALLEKNQPLEIIPPEFIEKLRREHSFVKREGLPIVCTHPINEEQDPTLQHLKRVGLDNSEDDNVKVIFMPAYLDGKDGLLDLEYYEAMSGCHLGIFPSYYEPWGYTPLESIAYGVPAITANTAGFGKYIEEEVVGTKNGMFVLDRMQGNAHATDELFGNLYAFAQLDREERIARKRNAHALSTYADWRQLIKYYLAAHCKALHRAGEQV